MAYSHSHAMLYMISTVMQCYSGEGSALQCIHYRRKSHGSLYPFMYTYLLCIYRLYFLLFWDKSYNPHPLCLVYYMPPGFSPVVVSHGNSKSMEPTLPSTFVDIKRKCASYGLKEIISSIDSCVGGIAHASYRGELPHNEQQVSNFKYHVSVSGE